MADKLLNSLDFGTGDIYYPLPKVTSADADKILMVDADGNWSAASITNAEEVAY